MPRDTGAFLFMFTDPFFLLGKNPSKDDSAGGPTACYSAKSANLLRPDYAGREAAFATKHEPRAGIAGKEAALGVSAIATSLARGDGGSARPTSTTFLSSSQLPCRPVNRRCALRHLANGVPSRVLT